MMNFKFDDADLQQCLVNFNSLDPEQAPFYNHYELAKQTRIKDASLWKRFLLDKRVSEYLAEEMQLFKEAQYRKLIQGAASNDRSVGAAQMLNALGKTMDGESSKDGAMFVYMCVPLNEREQSSPNVNQLDYNIFERS